MVVLEACLKLVMEQFIREARYPTLAKFCNEHPKATKLFIMQSDAKKNLQHKMKIAFQNVKGKRKRGVGVEVNLVSLFAEAKAETTISAEGWNTLGSSGATISRQIREINKSVPQSENSEPENLAEEEEVVPSETEEEDDMTQVEFDGDYILENGVNVSARFRRYNSESNKKSKEEGFYIDGNLHEILSLSHVLLLKENEYSESLMEYFGLENLITLHESLKEKYIDTSIKMETPIFNKITSVLRGLNFRTARRKTKQLINDIAKDASDEDDRLIDIIVNWLNTDVQDTESQRPDGNMFQLEQRRIQFSTGFVEVKPDKTRAQTRKIHEDTLRLVNFCKDTIDKQNVKSMISVQVVGYYVTIYLISLEANGLYLMIELFSLNVSKCISEELPPFVKNLDQLKQIMLSHETHCIFSNENRTLRKRSFFIQQASLNEIINAKKPKKNSVRRL